MYGISQLAENPSSRIDILSLTNNCLDDDYVTTLCDALVVNNTLRSLNLGSNSTITATGWRALSTAISHSMCSLEDLWLIDSHICDEGVIYLGNALTFNTTLYSLHLCRNNSITLTGWQGFSNCLRSPNSALKKLELNYCNIGNESANVIISALADNKGLEKFYMIDYDEVEDEVWNSLLSAFCDKTSIDNTHSSNHSLYKIAVNGIIPDDVQACLQMNKYSKSEAARRKILANHFSGGGTDTNVFTCMPDIILPQAMAWIGKSRNNLEFSLMFSVLRRSPTTCDVRRHWTKVHGSAKKKRSLDE